MIFAIFKAAVLFFPAYGEPKFDEVDAVADEVAFKFRGFPDELAVLIMCTKYQQMLDTGPVVPGPGKQ